MLYGISLALRLQGKGFSVLKGVLSGARAQMASTQLPDGSVAVFGGGEDSAKIKYSGVDIFTAATGVWTTANLSQPRSFLAAASVALGGRALSVFAGGECSEGHTGTDSARVDIYDHGKQGWIVNADLLSQPRKKLAAASGTLEDSALSAWCWCWCWCWCWWCWYCWCWCLLVADCWLLAAGCWLLLLLLLLLLLPPPLPLLLRRLACDLTSPLCAAAAYLVRAAGPYILVGGGYTSGMKNSTARGYSNVVDIFHAGTGEHPAKPRAY